MEAHAATIAGLRARDAETNIRSQIAAAEVVSVADFNVLTSFAFRNWNADAVGTDGSDAVIMVRTLPSGGEGARDAEAKMRAGIAAGESISVEVFNVLTSFAFRAWDVDAVGTDGSTAMIMTCTQGSVEDVRGLLAARADPTLEALGYNHGADETFQEFPLAVASLAGHMEVVRLLLAHERVDPQQGTTDTGGSALFCACRGGRTNVVGLLLSLDGVDVNQARSDDGATPLCIA